MTDITKLKPLQRAALRAGYYSGVPVRILAEPGEVGK